MDIAHITDITRRLYRITDHIDDRDPLKWRLRGCALDVFEVMSSDAIRLKFRDQHSHENAFQILLNMLNLSQDLFLLGYIDFRELESEYRLVEETLKKPVTPVPSGPISEGEIKGEPSTKTIVSSITDRQKKILGHLSVVGSSSVGEMLSLFGGSISEKTLQRDLFDLVQIHKVRAEGEKRWRKYHFNSVGIASDIIMSDTSDR